jgi:hypothetical protein
MDYKIDRHCSTCNKTFRCPAELGRHKRKKRPCGALTTQHTKLFSCEFCDRTYKHDRNRTTHYKTCKVKLNTDAGIVARFKQKDRKMVEQAKMIEDMRKELDMVKTELRTGGQQTGNGNTQNIHNGDNNIAITINSYKTPDISDIKVELTDLLADKLIKTVMESIYFNPNKPENHCILSQNIKQGRVAVYDNGWKLITSDREMGLVIDAVKATCLKEGGNLIELCDQQDLTPVQTNKIQSFNGLEHEGEACITDDEVLKVFHKHRDMVTATKKVNV